MIKVEFWRVWNHKNEFEKSAIKIVRAIKKIILREIPNSKINSIYLKGSFIRREMNKNSDIDFVIILNDNKYILKAGELGEKYKNEFDIEVGISVHSLWELENNKHFYKPKGARASPFLFLRKVGDYGLICGNEIEPVKLSLKDAREHLKKRVKTFRDLFIPWYLKGDGFGFHELIKQVFWLVEIEQESLGKTNIDTWKKLDDSIDTKNHIMHVAYKYRNKYPKNKRDRVKYVYMLEKYLDKLEVRLK